MEEPRTAVVLDQAPCTNTDVVQSSAPPPGTRPVMMLPRYQAFTPASIAPAQCGAQFREIAGNSTMILVSAVGASSAPARPEARELFALPILTQPGLERRAYIVPISQLSTFLNGAGRGGLAIEHVFDY